MRRVVDLNDEKSVVMPMNDSADERCIYDHDFEDIETMLENYLNGDMYYIDGSPSVPNAVADTDDADSHQTASSSAHQNELMHTEEEPRARERRRMHAAAAVNQNQVVVTTSTSNNGVISAVPLDGADPTWTLQEIQYFVPVDRAYGTNPDYYESYDTESIASGLSGSHEIRSIGELTNASIMAQASSSTSSINTTINHNGNRSEMVVSLPFPEPGLWLSYEEMFGLPSSSDDEIDEEQRSSSMSPPPLSATQLEPRYTMAETNTATTPAISTGIKRKYDEVEEVNGRLADLQYEIPEMYEPADDMDLINLAYYAMFPKIKRIRPDDIKPIKKVEPPQSIPAPIKNDVQTVASEASTSKRTRWSQTSSIDDASTSRNKSVCPELSQRSVTALTQLDSRSTTPTSSNQKLSLDGPIDAYKNRKSSPTLASGSSAPTKQFTERASDTADDKAKQPVNAKPNATPTQVQSQTANKRKRDSDGDAKEFDATTLRTAADEESDPKRTCLRAETYKDPDGNMFMMLFYST